MKSENTCSCLVRNGVRVARQVSAKSLAHQRLTAFRHMLCPFFSAERRKISAKLRCDLLLASPYDPVANGKAHRGEAAH